MLLTSRGVPYHAYSAGTQRSWCLWTFFHLYRYNNIVVFWNTWSKTMNGWIWSVERVNSLTDTLVQRAFIPWHRCMSQQPQKHDTPDTTPHPTCTRYCLGSSSTSLVSGYEFLLGLILGSEYGQERWLTYMRAYSPRWNLDSVLVRSLWTSRSKVCPAIELFFRVRTRLGQWFSRELIRDECICTRLTFAAQLIWVRCSDQIGNGWDKDQLPFGSQVFP